MSNPNKFFFDTCFYIDLFRGEIEDPHAFSTVGPCLCVGHAIVFMELYQGTRHEDESKAIRDLEHSLFLIGPTIENYIHAGKILQKMTQRGWITSRRLYEMQNDVLLALSALDQNSWIITRNKKDFEKIKTFCPINTIYY